MLNLSDNELDRLSREAASQHDPGDLTGPRSWDRLEVRLDKELGKTGPDMSRGMRGFRRLPFQYAPVILLIVGVSYYFVKTKGRKAEPSGSPPLTLVKTPQQQPGTTPDSSLKNPVYSDKSTSTLYPDQNQGKDAGKGSVSAPVTSGTPSIASGSSASSSNTANSGGSPSSGHSGDAGGAPTAVDRTYLASAGKNTYAPPAPDGVFGRGSHSGKTNHTGKDNQRIGKENHRTGKNNTDTDSDPSDIASTAGASAGRTSPGTQKDGFGLSLSFVQKPRNLRSRPTISDSALRAYTAQTPANPGKKSGPSLHINRSLTFGLQIAPDFTSVNALAGDRPGSSLGLTVDYQFLHGWHLGTGFLFSRKNFTARGTDYHVPYDYYMRNNIKGVDFVKGTMNLMEIPLNIRYDFSVTGNTIFFASGGVSTYLFGKEHCNYYYDFFGREVCRDFRYSNPHNGLFSSADLSLGVETGINNSLSLLVAPYMKLPISDIGFGRVRMNSVGINFAVRYAPVISRRKH